MTARLQGGSAMVTNRTKAARWELDAALVAVKSRAATIVAAFPIDLLARRSFTHEGMASDRAGSCQERRPDGRRVGTSVANHVW